MLDAIKRWFSRGQSALGGRDELTRWADERRHEFRGARGADGFVLEGRAGEVPWRLEWGPSQRAYIAGRELRLRAEPGLPRELHALVVTRTLAEAMEKTMFEQYVEGVQTRADTDTPPEMRWLVMYPKLSGTELRTLRERFVALASSKPWLLRWLEGPVATALSRAPLLETAPLALMVARGRLTLRTRLDDADPEMLDAWIRVFDTALREARRLGDPGPEPAATTAAPSGFTPDPPPPAG